MKIFLPLVFLIASSKLSAQSSVVQKILSDIHIDSSQLVARQIRSTHTYLERFMDNNDMSAVFITAEKRVEIEYNEAGNVVFRMYNGLSEEGVFLGGMQTSYAKIEYDENNKPVSICSNSNGTSTCKYLTYTSDGKIATLREERNNVPANLLTYTWKKELLTDVKITPYSENYFERTFDNTGKVSQIKYGETKIDYTYEDKGREVLITTTTYRKNVLHSKEVMMKTKTTDQISYYCSFNEKLDTMTLIKTTFDEFHNVTSINESNYSKLYLPPPPEPATSPGSPKIKSESAKRGPETMSYVIKNSYDNGLPVSRMIYITRNGYKRRNDKPDMIERIHYEKDGLTFKSWPGNSDY